MVWSSTYPNANCSVLMQILINFSTPASLHQLTPNFEILGASIGSPEFCGDYIEAKRKQACSLLHLLPQLCDPQVSILLLCHCASFCKLSHLSRSIPPWDSSLRQFMLFDDVLHCLEEYLNLHIQPPNKFNYHYHMVVLDWHQSLATPPVHTFHPKPCQMLLMSPVLKILSIISMRQ